jgi:ATP-dependent protease ClpP protease subunit
VLAVRRNQVRALVAGERRGEFRVKAGLFPSDDTGLTTASNGSVSELWLYDVIDPYADAWWGGISASMIVTALQGFGGSDLILHVNCPGGDVFEALAIYATLRNYGGKVTARIEGLSASAASFIMLAADEVITEPNAMVMIHDAIGFSVGNAAETRQFADLLDKTSQNVADIYAAKAGGTADEWRSRMLLETWYAGAEVVEAGLADSVADTGAGDTVGVSDRWDLGVFANAPRVSGPVDPAPRTADPEGDRPAPVPQPAPVVVPAPVAGPTLSGSIVVTDPDSTPPTDPVPAPVPAPVFDLESLRSALKGAMT